MAKPENIGCFVGLNLKALIWPPQVTELSGEGFAARLFREGNSGGFLRALTDLPTAFSGGINTVRSL
jgi:hypothetical protein